eukprot:10300-Heterococcus_DN1.PRE.2
MSIFMSSAVVQRVQASYSTQHNSSYSTAIMPLAQAVAQRQPATVSAYQCELSELCNQTAITTAHTQHLVKQIL